MNTVDLTTLPSEQSSARPSSYRDWLGIVASVGCAIHCAAMPFVIAYLPALGLSFLADESFHKWMALACFLIAIVAFIPGLRKHGNWVPVSIGAVGLTLITFAAFGLAGECCPSCGQAEANSANAIPIVSAVSDEGRDPCDTCCCGEECLGTATEFVAQSEERKTLLATLAPWITPCGGLILVCAHLLNRRHGCCCECC